MRKEKRGEGILYMRKIIVFRYPCVGGQSALTLPFLVHPLVHRVVLLKWNWNEKDGKGEYGARKRGAHRATNSEKWPRNPGQFSELRYSQ